MLTWGDGFTNWLHAKIIFSKKDCDRLETARLCLNAIKQQLKNIVIIGTSIEKNNVVWF